MRLAQNPPLPPRICPFLKKSIGLYAALPESTHPHQNLPSYQQLYAPSQNLPLPPRIYIPPPFQQLYATLPRIYPSLPEYIPPFQQINATLSESTLPPNLSVRPSQNLSLPPRIYPSLKKDIIILSGRDRFWEGLIIL